MVVDVTQRFVDLDGQPIGDTTFRKIACDLLLGTGCEKLNGEQKVARYDLALRIHREERPELSESEVGLLRNLIDANCPPLVVAQSRGMLGGQV